jgi:nicotinamide-nucleotide amidase
MEERIESTLVELKNLLTEKSLTLAVAESCTGGLLSHILTGISGASQYFLGGMIAYSNRIKIENLGVNEQTILLHGAVSQQTALEMAENIREKFDANIGLSTTGIAGPTGGTPTKPVGLVWLGISTESCTTTFECHFTGGRDQVKMSAVQEILHLLMERLSTSIE